MSHQFPETAKDDVKNFSARLSDMGYRLMTWVLVALSCLLAGAAVIGGLMPPYVLTSAGFAVCAATFLWVVFPIAISTSDQKRHWAQRSAIFCASLVFMVALVNVHMDRQDEKRTPQERLERAQQFKEMRARDREERLSEIAKEQDQRAQSKALKESREQEKAQAQQFKKDVQEESRRQRDFYDELGAPKLLYKCNDSPLERALGATTGTINRLLSDVQKQCGSAGYEILKRKE